MHYDFTSDTVDKAANITLSYDYPREAYNALWLYP